MTHVIVLSSSHIWELQKSLTENEAQNLWNGEKFITIEHKWTKDYNIKTRRPCCSLSIMEY